MSNPNISQQMQDEINRLNQTQQQMEYVAQSKMGLENQIKEMEFALKELEKVTEGTKIYKSIGGLMIESNPADTLKELKEKKESSEMRVKSLEKQEERLKASFEERRKILQKKYNKMNQNTQEED